MRRYDRHKVFWWSPPAPFGLSFLGRENVGDALGPALVERILNDQGLDIARIRKPKLLSIGSVMHFAKNHDTIWGTGVNGKIDQNFLSFQTLDVRAVRGPLTREVLRAKGIHAPEVYGDPGILVSRYWPKGPYHGKKLFVPHMREPLDLATRLKWHILSPLKPLNEFITIISGASIVYSSSLHGIVIAESFGVPAVLIRNTSGETPFKYDDYYAGTGRAGVPSFASLDEAASHTPSIPQLRPVADRLLKAFPFDLWLPSQD